MLSDAAILAFDPGGTKCHALLVRSDGQALGWGTGEGAGISGRSEHAQLMAARGALASQHPDSLYVVSECGNIKPLLKLGIPIRSLCCVGENDAAFALAGESYGLVVLSGTGSFVHGKTRDGRELTLDGLGPVLGDTGSAYYIGLMAMRAIAKSDWHPRFHTTLTPRFLQFFGLTMGELVAFSLKPKDRSVIAAFARIVDEEAGAGDPVARWIITEAADEIADILRAVVERLEMTQESYTIIGTGSVIRHSNIYWDRICELARGFAPLLATKRLRHPAVVGVMLAGMRRLQCPDYETAAATLLASYESVIEKGETHGSPTVS